MTTVWQISQMERTLADGGVIVAHWRANASETVGEGDDAVTYSATNYGTAGFTPDPSASDYVPYDDITEDLALSWCFANGVDKDAIEASLQANIDGQINPTQAAGVPW
jgi:hypothetical protein